MLSISVMMHVSAHQGLCEIFFTLLISCHRFSVMMHVNAH